MTLTDEEYDILICGAGPTGLFLAICIEKCNINYKDLNLKIKIIDDLNDIPIGRSDAFHPRSIEILDQVGIAEKIMEKSITTNLLRTYIDGELFDESHWVIDPNEDITKFPFMALTGQQHILKIFSDILKELPNKLNVERSNKMINFTYDNNLIKVYVKNTKINLEKEIKTKYYIGCDGGRSFTRKKLGIQFKGDTTKIYWGVIDAELENIEGCKNLPKEGIIFMQSEDSIGYHSAFVIQREENIHRLLTLLDPNEIEIMIKKNNEIEYDYILDKLKKAVKPFDLNIKGEPKWWTMFVVNQRVAENFKENNIFLAGDSAHCHSPSLAQGMNTGLHDSYNLAWKLVWVERGWANKDILLETYEMERKKIAHEVINMDKIIASLRANEIPEIINYNFTKNTQLIGKTLTYYLKKYQKFYSGFGIEYDQNYINKINFFVDLKVKTGQRTPDVIINNINNKKIRLFSIMPYNGKFHILVFIGDLNYTKEKYYLWKNYIKSNNSFLNRYSLKSESAFKIITITTTKNIDLQNYKNIEIEEDSFYIDNNIYKKQAHDIYGIDVKKGAIIIVRPDGWISYTLYLEDYIYINNYFDRFLLRNLNY
jgi:phenol 2-monooxygenase